MVVMKAVPYSCSNFGTYPALTTGILPRYSILRFIEMFTIDASSGLMIFNNRMNSSSVLVARVIDEILLFMERRRLLTHVHERSGVQKGSRVWCDLDRMNKTTQKNRTIESKIHIDSESPGE